MSSFIFKIQMTRSLSRSLLLGGALVVLSFSVAWAQSAVDATPPSPDALMDGLSTEDLMGETIDPVALGLNPEDVKGMEPEEILLLSVQKQMATEINRLDYVDPDLRSLFLSADDSKKLRDAIEKRMTGQGDRDPLDTLLQTGDEAVDEVVPREVALGGIVYRDGKDWTIWLNNQRMTPDRLSPQIKGIKVYKGYVELQWLDGQSGKVIPIRLRPNQRFDLETRRFLPG